MFKFTGASANRHSHPRPPGTEVKTVESGEMEKQD